jgi:hypothetical protein
VTVHLRRGVADNPTSKDRFGLFKNCKQKERKKKERKKEKKDTKHHIKSILHQTQMYRNAVPREGLKMSPQTGLHINTYSFSEVQNPHNTNITLMSASPYICAHCVVSGTHL